MTHETLLGKSRQPQLWMAWSLPTCVGVSACGALCLKYGQTAESLSSLVAGYILEGCAFLLYPQALHYYPLRVVMVSWAAVGTVNAIMGGWLFFGEVPSVLSLVGCVLVMSGVVLTTF